jgi:hypothetical protein
MVTVVNYTVALYPILLKADASKKKYKQVFIYYLLGQQKTRLVELERCFEEAIGLHHGLCWLCEVFLQIFSSVFWYCCSTKLQNRWTVFKWFVYKTFLQCKHLLYPVTVKKGTLQFIVDRSLIAGITALPMSAVIWRTDYYPNTVRNSRL